MRFIVHKVAPKQVSPMFVSVQLIISLPQLLHAPLPLCFRPDQEAYYHSLQLDPHICYVAGCKWRKLSFFSVLMMYLHVKFDIHIWSGLLIIAIKLKAKYGFYILNFDTVWSWLVSFMLWMLDMKGTSPHYPLIRRVDGTCSQSVHYGEGLDFGCPAHTLVTIPAELSQVWPPFCFFLILKWCKRKNVI